MTLQFDDRDPVWNGARMTVHFLAHSNSTRVVCAVSIEALQDHFGVQGFDGDEAVPAAIANKSTIESVAQQLYGSRPLDPDGLLIIKTADF